MKALILIGVLFFLAGQWSFAQRTSKCGTLNAAKQQSAQPKAKLTLKSHRSSKVAGNNRLQAAKAGSHKGRSGMPVTAVQQKRVVGNNRLQAASGAPGKGGRKNTLMAHEASRPKGNNLLHAASKLAVYGTIEAPSLGFGPAAGKRFSSDHQFTVKGNTSIREKRTLLSKIRKRNVYRMNAAPIGESRLSVKGNEQVRTKRKLASKFSKKSKYRYHRQAAPDALSLAPESKKKKNKRIKKTKQQGGLFEPGVLKTSKFPK